jgi:hypothetical protein
MVYFDPASMSETNRNLLIEWIRAEGLDPDDILGDGSFSVHNGRVSGSLLQRPVAIWKGKPLTTYFNYAQQNPLPGFEA